MTTIGSAGELLVEFVATERDGHHRRTARYAGPFPSGAPAIFIDQAARLGARTIISGAVGADAFGEIIRDRLAADGVDTRLIAPIAGRPTGSAFVSYNTDNTRDFVFNIAHSAAARFPAGPSTLKALLDFGVDVFHVSGSSLGDPTMARALLELAEGLRGAGVNISFDPNVRNELLGDAAYFDAVSQLMGMASLFLPSEEDAAALFPGAALADFAAPLLGANAECVVLKRGAAGCAGVSRSGEMVTLGAHDVVVSDPTGAGDCFCATFVSFFAAGSGFGAALKYANAAGALAVGRTGPMEGNSSRARLETFLATGT